MNGKKIAEIRKIQRLSQEELAEKAQVSRSIISFLETGKEKDVKLLRLPELLKLLIVRSKIFYNQKV